MSLFVFSIGLIAQFCFSVRILIQWLLSEREQKILAPTFFWIFSLLGSYLMFYYGWLRADFSIITGQFISFYIYIGNLYLKGVWNKLPQFLQWILLFLPLGITISLLKNEYAFVDHFLGNEKIPMFWLFIGMIGQLLFIFRFVYQWIYSYRIQESVLPTTFWWISLYGALLIIIYAILRQDWILILGHGFGIVSYVRNLKIGYKYSRMKGGNE